MAVILLFITLAMFLVQKYYLEAKGTATLSGKASRQRMRIMDRPVTVPLSILCCAMAISDQIIVMQKGVVDRSLLSSKRQICHRLHRRCEFP